MIQKDYALAAALQKLVGFGSHFPIRVHPDVDARAPEQQQLRDEHLAQLREVRLRGGERHALRRKEGTRLLLVSSCTEALLMLLCAYVLCVLSVFRAFHSTQTLHVDHAVLMHKYGVRRQTVQKSKEYKAAACAWKKAKLSHEAPAMVAHLNA